MHLGDWNGPITEPSPLPSSWFGITKHHARQRQIQVRSVFPYLPKRFGSIVQTRIFWWQYRMYLIKQCVLKYNEIYFLHFCVYSSLTLFQKTSSNSDRLSRPGKSLPADQLSLYFTIWISFFNRGKVGRRTFPANWCTFPAKPTFPANWHTFPRLWNQHWEWKFYEKVSRSIFEEKNGLRLKIRIKFPKNKGNALIPIKIRQTEAEIVIFMLINLRNFWIMCFKKWRKLYP